MSYLVELFQGVDQSLLWQNRMQFMLAHPGVSTVASFGLAGAVAGVALGSMYSIYQWNSKKQRGAGEVFLWGLIPLYAGAAGGNAGVVAGIAKAAFDFLQNRR